MKIATFIMCHNEEKLLPYTLRHYLQFSEVTVLENNSTDRSVEIAKSMGAKVWDLHCPDEFNDYFNRNAKNNCWKMSTADWVIVVDCDEFVVFEDLSILDTTSATILETEWYEMYSDKFPTTEGQIYEEVRMGHLGRTKRNLFRRCEIKDINYDNGSHNAFPSGDVRIQSTNLVKTLHFRHLGMDYIMERNAHSQARMSQENKERGISIHFAYPREKVQEEYDEGMKIAKLIL